MPISTRNRRAASATTPSSDIYTHQAAAIIRSIIPRVTRSSRTTKPRCLHFASSKTEFEQKYPDHFFCSKCENIYNDFILTPQNNFKRNVNSRAYYCVATHDNFITPTHLKSVFCRLKIDDDDDNDNDSDDSNIETLPLVKKQKMNTHYKRKSLIKSLHTVQQLVSKSSHKVEELENKDEDNETAVRKILNSYKEKIISLQKDLEKKEYIIKDKSKQIASLLKQLNDSSDMKDALIAKKCTSQYGEESNNKAMMLVRLINLHLNKPKFSSYCELSGTYNNTNDMVKQGLFHFVNDLLLKEENGLFCGKLRTVVIQCVTNWYRRCVFNPFLLIQKMDKSNHVLSLCGIELLRDMISCTKNKQENLFPASSTIQKVATIVSQRGKQAVPYQLKFLPTCFGGAESVE